MPFNIKFPTFNPGLSLASNPYSQQTIGSPQNAANLAATALTPEQMAQFTAPAAAPVAAAAPAANPLASAPAAQNMLNASRWSNKNVPRGNVPYMDMFGLTGRGGGHS